MHPLPLSCGGHKDGAIPIFHSARRVIGSPLGAPVYKLGTTVMKKDSTEPLHFVLLEDDPNDAELIQLQLARNDLDVTWRPRDVRKRFSRGAGRHAARSGAGRLHAARLRRSHGPAHRAGAIGRHSLHFRVRLARRGARDRSAQERRHRLRAEGSTATLAHGGQSRAVRGARSSRAALRRRPRWKNNASCSARSSTACPRSFTRWTPRTA